MPPGDESTAAPTAPPLPHTHSDELAGLFERYHQELYRLCLGLLDDPHEAEDAVQETFLRAHRAWSSFDAQRAAARTWLGQIAVNYCRSILRRRRVRATYLRWLGLGHAPTVQVDSHQADLRGALRQLDERLRSVLLLRYYMGFSCAEIAVMLDLSEGTVHSRLWTARQRLQRVLGQEDE